MRTRWYYPTRYDRHELRVELQVRLNREERQRLAEAIHRNGGELTLPFWNTLYPADVTEPVIVLAQEDSSWEREGETRREAIAALADMLLDELAELRALLRA